MALLNRVAFHRSREGYNYFGGVFLQPPKKNNPKKKKFTFFYFLVLKLKLKIDEVQFNNFGYKIPSVFLTLLE